jgi:hypothetical protein
VVVNCTINYYLNAATENKRAQLKSETESVHHQAQELCAAARHPARHPTRAGAESETPKQHFQTSIPVQTKTGVKSFDVLQGLVCGGERSGKVRVAADRRTLDRQPYEGF